MDYPFTIDVSTSDDVTESVNCDGFYIICRAQGPFKQPAG